MGQNKKTILDANNQPISRLYSRKRLSDRAVDEMIGLARGIVADNIINHEEAQFLLNWMELNVPCCEDVIVNQLYCRVQEMLIDGIFDDDEQQELFDLLKMFTGDILPEEDATNKTTLLPLDDPPPRVEIPTMTYCLTGRFAYGPRRVCQEIVTERGGYIKTGVSTMVDYLVIGYFGSTDWIHTPYGRKIEKAAQLRDQGSDIAIISEDHWLDTAFKM